MPNDDFEPQFAFLESQRGSRIYYNRRALDYTNSAVYESLNHHFACISQR